MKANAASLKVQYIKYFEDVPVQKYAAMYVGRDEDTIIRWKHDDSKFADAVSKAKANWIRKRVIATKAEFALERLESEIFGPNNAQVYGSVNPTTEEKIAAFLDDKSDDLES